MFPYVVPWLGEVRSKWEKNMYYLIASLFAYHPVSTETGNLGDIFRELYLKRQENPSLEQRFITLLKSNPEDVPFHIRQAISLAKSDNIPINWYELFFDLLRWNNVNYPPYEKWAQSFWKQKKVE
ncbi:CRISPR-associated protein Cse2 [subsurface metagenome]